MSDASAREQFWVHGLRVHRELMQNRSIIVFFVRAYVSSHVFLIFQGLYTRANLVAELSALVFTNKSLAITIERALEFFTRVNIATPIKLWSEVVWQIGGVIFGYHIEGSLRDLDLLRRIAERFWDEYEKAAKE